MENENVNRKKNAGKAFLYIFICGANQEVPVSACLPVRQSQILSSGTKLYSPNLCLLAMLLSCLFISSS